MGLALPIIAEYFLGRACGVIVAIVVLLIGGILVISGHVHHEEGMSVPRKKKLAAYAVAGALLALGLMGIRSVYAREYARSSASLTKPAAVQPLPTTPDAINAPTTPGANDKDQKKNPHTLLRPPASSKPQDNSVHIGTGANVQQQTSGNCSPNIIGGASTVNCASPPPPPPHVTICVSSPLRVKQLDSDVVETVFTFTTDSAIDAPAYELFFDKSVLKSSSTSSPDIALNIDEGVDDKQKGFVFQLKQKWYPGSRLNAVIYSASEVKLLSKAGNHDEIYTVTEGQCNSAL